MKNQVLGLLAAAVLVAGCGGGGGDAGTPPFGNESSGGGGGSGSLPASSTLAQQCSPNNPLAPSNRRTASLDTERRWVRSYVDEAYLWYRDVPTVDASRPEFNLADVPAALDTSSR
jgi:carboxyl-terminal processing protease